MRINCSLDDVLVKRIDDYAEKNYMSRSGFISMACVQFLNAQEMPSALRQFSSVLQRIAEDPNAEVTEDDLSKIEALSSLADTFK